MSESLSCVEQREEEQTELEEAGGAEVRWFKPGIVSSQRRVQPPQTCRKSRNLRNPLFDTHPYFLHKYRYVKLSVIRVNTDCLS